MAGDLDRVEIDPDDLDGVVQPPVGLDALEARADGERHVDLGPQAVRHGQAERERRAVVHDAAAHPAGDHRRAERLRQRAHLRARALSAAAREDHRSRRAVQQLGRAQGRFWIGPRIGHLAGAGHLGGEPCLLRQHVHRHLERHRPRPAGLHPLERLGDQARRLVRRLDARRPLGQALHDAELVGQLMQQAEAAADAVQRHLAGEAEDGGIAGVRRRQRRGGVEKAGAGHDAIGARPTARCGVAVGHVAGRLLVPGDDHAQLLGGIVQRAEQRVVLHARQDEQGVDGLRQKSLHRGLAAGHLGHRCVSCVRSVDRTWHSTGRHRNPKRLSTSDGCRRSLDHLFLVDRQGTRHIDCSDAPLPYYARLIADVFERTETAMPQAHCFKVCELALAAQARAVRLA